MSIRSPVSHSSFVIRVSALDAVCAMATPVLALWIRGAPPLSPLDWPTVALYCGISFGFALVAFVAFRINDSVTHLFSVGDALQLTKAVALSELMTCLVLFSVTRLEGIPRTTPIIHALLLAAALILVRSYRRMRRAIADRPSLHGTEGPEHIIVIGANKLSALYLGFLSAYAPNHFRVIGLLDDRPEMTGRTLAGVRVLGPINHLLPIIEEFKEHGISTDRILIGGDAELLPAEMAAQVRGICSMQELRLDFIPRLLGLKATEQARPQGNAGLGAANFASAYSPPPYHSAKRVLDFAASLALFIVLLPVLIVVAGIVLFDVGLPVLFWQQRIGRNGESFQLHKFRTLKPSFDWDGRALSEEERQSSVGSTLRRLRLDELPQLLNVLIGDMSLVGPRPLLPRDQPPNPAVRLSIRPGMTGWAQVHGGTLLTPEEKSVLDEWYVRNASLWIDLTILLKTVGILLRGERRPGSRPGATGDDAFGMDAHQRSLSGT
jgi:lipopolysaccharide/colanic/teichoic acid biosynthesis glycosyltransferase